MPYSLADLDKMTIDQAQALPFDERDQLLDLMIADGRHQATDMHSYRVGLYCDYFDEDITSMLKVKAIRVICRGSTPSDFEGQIVGDNEDDQYRACFRHLQTTLEAAGTRFDRVVNLVVFLTDMEKWSKFNEIYREFIPNPLCRAVIGTTGLAQAPLTIELVDCVAYRVAD